MGTLRSVHPIELPRFGNLRAVAETSGPLPGACFAYGRSQLTNYLRITIRYERPADNCMGLMCLIFARIRPN